MRASKLFTKILAAGLLFSFMTAGGGWSISLSIKKGGTWIEEFDQNNLQDGPGSELFPSVETDLLFGEMDISQTNLSWEVTMYRTVGMWHPNLLLYIRRTSNGNGKEINGGTTYQEITELEQLFFWGRDDCKNINFQMKVDGISTQLGLVEYTTTVTYTLTETI